MKDIDESITTNDELSDRWVVKFGYHPHGSWMAFEAAHGSDDPRNDKFGVVSRIA